MNISEFLRAHRKAAGLTQKQLSDALGTGQTVISRYERGERSPTVETLQRIAAALDCELVIEFRPKG